MRQDVIAAASPDAQRVARDAITKIKSIHTGMVEGVVGIGRELLRVKEALGHGNFTPWLKESFDWSERTALNYMAVAEQFGTSAQIRNAVSVLPLATVYKLAAPSTPASVRADVVQRLEAGETVDPVEITTRLSEVARTARLEAEAEKKIARRNPKLSAVQVKETRQARERRMAEQLDRDRRDRETKAAALADAVGSFVKSLDATQRSGLRALVGNADWYVTSSDFSRALGAVDI